MQDRQAEFPFHENLEYSFFCDNVPWINFFNPIIFYFQFFLWIYNCVGFMLKKKDENAKNKEKNKQFNMSFDILIKLD